MTSIFMENFLCSNLLINLAFFIMWIIAITVCPDLIYNWNQKFVPMDKKDWYRVNYFLMGFYKILLIIFVLAPYIALKMS